MCVGSLATRELHKTRHSLRLTAPTVRLLILTGLLHRTAYSYIKQETVVTGGSKDAPQHELPCNCVLNEPVGCHSNAQFSQNPLAFTAQYRNLHPPLLCCNILTKQSGSRCYAIVGYFLFARTATLHKQTRQ